jgi:hypothetical protein
MRIKKKHIKESIKDLKNTLDNTEKTIGEFIPKTKETLEKLGFKSNDAAETATKIVKGVVGDNEVNEVAVSDSQIEFFNALYKCKTEGDCGSESIKKAAEGMSLKDIEDYAFTKGELPKSVDENYSNFYNDPKMITKDMFDDLKGDMSGAQLKKFSPEARMIKDKIAKLINASSRFDISVINIFNLINNSKDYTDYLNKVQDDLNIHSKNKDMPLNEGDPNDDKLTVGELRQSLEILKKAKNKEEAIASAKSIGKDVLRIVGAFLTMGQSETASLIANVAVDGAGLVGKLLDPKSPPEKNPDPFMQQLQIDPNVSKLLDDKVEYDFIKYAENGLKNMSDDDEIPNFFNELQKFIRDKYTTDYNVSKSINLKKKNESVRPSMTKDELIETVKTITEGNKKSRQVLKTIKVKNLRK